MPLIEANHIVQRYQLDGQGSNTLILIHEMGGLIESWDDVMPVVTRGRQVLRYDVRGAGLSEKIRDSVTFDQLADDLAALMDKLGIRTAALAGCAVGAGIAIRFAVRFPERVKALVAMAPATGIPAERRAAMLAGIDAGQHNSPRLSEKADLELGYPLALRTEPKRYEQFRLRWLQKDPESAAAIYRMLIASELDDQLPQIHCPVLMIAGSHDTFRPPAAVEALSKRIPGARFKALPTGHFMAVQTPEMVAECIAGFLVETGLDQNEFPILPLKEKV